MRPGRISFTVASGFSPVIDFHDCVCYSHNGFLTRRGYAMKAASLAMGLTGVPKAVTIDKVASVSASESEARVTSMRENQNRLEEPVLPPGAGEVTGG